MRWVVLTDKLRGVYFGRTKASDKCKDVTLFDARICFSYTADAGIGCLPTVGPGPGSKIGPTMPHLSVVDRANMMECTEEAVRAWQKAEWAS